MYPTFGIIFVPIRRKCRIPGVMLNDDVVLRNSYDVINNFVSHFKSVLTHYSTDIFNHSVTGTNVLHVNVCLHLWGCNYYSTGRLKNKFTCGPNIVQSFS